MAKIRNSDTPIATKNGKKLDHSYITGTDILENSVAISRKKKKH